MQKTKSLLCIASEILMKMGTIYTKHLIDLLLFNVKIQELNESSSQLEVNNYIQWDVPCWKVMNLAYVQIALAKCLLITYFSIFGVCNRC